MRLSLIIQADECQRNVMIPILSGTTVSIGNEGDEFVQNIKQNIVYSLYEEIVIVNAYGKDWLWFLQSNIW